MALHFLRSSYLQYKADTNEVESWLVETAEKCGYAPDLLKGSVTGQQWASSKRLKGKVRKDSRATANEPQEGSSQPASTPTYIRILKSYSVLAEYIASFDQPAVSVPAYFVAAIDRAIAVRRDYGAYVSSLLPATAQNRASDERHSHFIGVLERVRDILRPECQVHCEKTEELNLLQAISRQMYWRNYRTGSIALSFMNLLNSSCKPRMSLPVQQWTQRLHQGLTAKRRGCRMLKRRTLHSIS